MKKRSIALLLVLSLLLSMLPLTVTAAQPRLGGVCVNNLTGLKSALSAGHTDIIYEGAPEEILEITVDLLLPVGTTLNMNGTGFAIMGNTTVTIMEGATLINLDGEVVLGENSTIQNEGDLSAGWLLIDGGTVHNNGHIYGNQIHVGGTLYNNSSMTVGSTIEVSGCLQGSADSFIELHAFLQGDRNEIWTAEDDPYALQLHADSRLAWTYNVADTAALQEAIADFEQRFFESDHTCVQQGYLINWDEDQNAADLVLTEDIILPDGCHLVILNEGENGSLTMTKGVTLTVSSFATIEVYGPMDVQGTLCNEGFLTLGDPGAITLGSRRSYTGMGGIFVTRSDDCTDPFDVLSGFDERSFEIIDLGDGWQLWWIETPDPGPALPPSPDPEPEIPENERRDISFGFLSDGVGQYTFNYTDDFFNHPATEYDHELAIASLSMAMAAFDDGGSGHIDALMDDLDMDGERVLDYHTHYSHTVCYAIGSKQIVTENDGEATLIAVAVCGSGYEAEWGGNFEVGSTGDHYGFRTISNEVLLGLQAYIARRLEQGTLSENVKIWITGYSRASACANLTAAMLTDGYMEKAHDLVIPPENIYAYCFEVPQGTTDTDRVIGYENIFNIVNPIDPVPKVAPVGWGFGRYGITYYLPSAETDPDYSRQLMEATREYTRIVKGTTENGLVALKQLTGQGAKLDAILSGITLAVSRKTYAEELEPILVPAISRVTQEGDGRPYTDQLALGIVEVLRKHPIKFMRVTDILTKVLGSPLTACIVGETVTEQVLSAIGFKGSSSFSTLELALSTMFHAHYPELTLAWMHTVTDFDGNDVDPWYRRLYVNCPVDLSVYDSEGVLVAQFIADEPQFIEGSMIPAFLDGAGQKIVILPPGEEYRVEITATDDGTMSYAVAECHAENGQAERLLHYYDVEITEGDALTAELPVAEEMQAEEYPLFMAEEEIEVSETLEISAEQEAIPTYTIELEVLGDAEVMGGGIYLRGEYAQLSYTSDHPFLGWYEDGQLLSVDPEYRFRMEGDRNIRAEFDCTDITGLSVDPEGRISAAVYRLPEGTSALLTAALYENEQLKDLQTITVEDDGRYVFDRLVHRNGLEYRVFLTGTDVWLPLCRKKGSE